MPALIPTDHFATITWLGRVTDRDTKEISAEAIDEMPLTLAGFEGEFHAGLTRPSCSRVLGQYPRGTEIRNTRQMSILSAEEIAEIATDLGLDALDPAWLGASIVVSGIADFSHLPPAARLQSESGTTVTIDLQNGPCQFPAMTIEAARPGHGKRFKPVAEGKRGVTAWVERAGVLRVGDRMRLHVPEQRAWQPEQARQALATA
ncbi:MOSC domain-containing protein [Roseisalinus antarcticus]|uniref:Putative metal-sulfur cluster biosynthesis proteins YuaD n=1 Tax=Roseisalinus antarcticus TaxID=254357 RepID=A0A1Y5T001_9RHOB|nr:MOSC domain-containing protein [Roseisalinus antarcticus]SLN50901.1 Putative metal-sulfur cluster biosynthesis proteins YuaD [Roseisalinus antarcticus]